MIKSKYIILLLLFVFGFTKTWGQLSKVSGHIYDIQTIDGKNYIAVGEGGGIRTSSDGGTNWNLSKPAGYEDLFAISIVSDKVSYACGNNGVYKSVDSGITWELKGDFTFMWLEDINFIDENNGFVLIANGNISKTTDGGTTWIECKNPKVADTRFGFYDKMHFKDVNTGYVSYYSFTGRNFTYITTDAGKSWEQVSENMRFISWYNDSMGYAIKGDRTFSKTLDNGKSWTDYPLGIDDFIMDIIFTSEKNGYLATAEGSVYYTHDGGITWNLGTNQSTSLNAIAASSLTDEIIAVGYNASILLSETNDDNWSLRSLGPPHSINLKYINATSENIGYTFSSDYLFKTFDAGTTWSLLPKDFEGNIKGNYFTSSEVGFIIAGNDLLKTTDGGNSWIKISEIDYNTKEILFIDDYTGFLYGDWSTLYKTYDGGITWVEKELPHVPQSDIGIEDMQFLNDMVGYAIGKSNAICKTIDGGETWIITANITGSSLLFLDENLGYTGGSTLKKTSDGGTTWTTIPFQEIIGSIVAESIVDIYFTDENNGFIITNYGSVYQTFDSGNNWTTLPHVNTNLPLNEIGAFGPTNLVIAGGDGLLLKNFTSTTANISGKVSPTLINTFSELDITTYPNPVSDILYINYEGNKGSNVEIQLYAMNGQELLKQNINLNDLTTITLPNTYKGLAILKIIGNKQSLTKKIIIQ
jgi:photosystem II stability/assembly factor-like uncharacterized protein